MSKIKPILFFAALATLVLAAGCGPHNSSDANAGFSVRTFLTIRSIDQFGNVVSQFDVPESSVISGVWLFDNSGASGTLTSFGPVQTPGTYTATGARAPARWRIFTNLPGLFFCAPIQTDFDVIRGAASNYRCRTDRFVVVFAVNPGSIDAQNPPGTLTISGSGISTDNGMPVVTAYDEIGNVAGQETATSVASDGSWLTINTPSGLTVSNTSYTLSVENIQSDGSQNLAGVGSVYVYNVTQYDPPPDPCTSQPRDGEQMPCLQTY